jgi:hypothetical protein
MFSVLEMIFLFQEVPSMLLFNDEYQEVPSTSSHKTKKSKSKKSVEKSEKPKKQKHASSKSKLK